MKITIDAEPREFVEFVLGLNTEWFVELSDMVKNVSEGNLLKFKEMLKDSPDVIHENIMRVDGSVTHTTTRKEN